MDDGSPGIRCILHVFSVSSTLKLYNFNGSKQRHTIMCDAMLLVKSFLKM